MKVKKAKASPTFTKVKRRAALVIFSVAAFLCALNKLDVIFPFSASSDPSLTHGETFLSSLISKNDSTTTNPHDPLDNFKKLHPLLKAALLRTSGGGGRDSTTITTNSHATGWEISPVSAYPNYACKWMEFKSRTGKTTKFCGHSDPDGVTSQIEAKKHFHHCDILPDLWNKADKKEDSIYLEIGANIGSCVVEMLLSTDAKIIAFEPHPKNLFVLLNTIAAMEESYQERVVIIPVALGGDTSIQTIYAAHGNMGNSVVGKIIKDNRKQQFEKEDQHTIHVERLDSIISPNVHVAFSKMDAQGFECNIVNGIGATLAKKIGQVKFEVSRNHLNNHGCLDLLSKFRTLGYTIYHEDLSTKIETGEHDQFNRMTELIAKRDN